jgi:sigma-B regulation protein RsbU (phosphoserine phosphatase)
MVPQSPTTRPPRWFRGLRVAAAVAFAAWTLLFSICWMAAARASLTVELGFDAPTFLQAEHALLIANVKTDSPAEKAGMRLGDHLVAIDGEPLANADSQSIAWSRHQPGESVRLTIARPGQPSPIVLIGIFRRAGGTASGYLGNELRNWYPVPFVLVGLTVLFLRLEDRNVWLLALLLGSFTTTSGSTNGFAGVAPALRPPALAYGGLFIGLVGPLFYWFFAIFPARSPIERRLPWVKWLAVALGLSMALPGLAKGRLVLPGPLATMLRDPASDHIPFWYEFSFLALGLASLALNFFSTRDRETIRKIRVIFWGTTIGLAPPLGRLAAQQAFAVTAPQWLNALNAALVFLFPLSFAYAVVKHRVLEIPVLLKRSARYLLVQRGFALSLSLVSIALTLLFAFSFASRLQPLVEVAGPSGIVLGAVFGTAVLWGGLRVHRQVSERIDRAFFRSAYDARVILEDLAEQTRTARSREEMALLIERHLAEALKPASLFVYLAGLDNRLVATAGQPPHGLETIPSDLPTLKDLAERGVPWEVPRGNARVPADAPIVALDADCLVPIIGRSRHLDGLLVLGTRLSEEPYSGEDKRLLASVASQAATALDNIRFAEDLAGRIENERRVAREMEIARDVQTRLLPQAPPQMRTAQCAARCIQARSVGGDYYDFLDLGNDRVGFVLADVSGKGVHAALLSASLQAHLRSQAALAPLEPVRLLRHLNDIIWKSTAAQHYATLFLGLYDDGTRRMRYVNCGHNPPVVVRRDGAIERLGVTAPVVGLFEEWECRACELQMAAGDLLAIFSDGITEALRGEEEFGEARLLEQLRAHPDLPASAVVAAVLDKVQAFSAGQQSDDLTLLVVRGV